MVVAAAVPAPVTPANFRRAQLITFSAALLGAFTSGIGAQMVNSSIADIQGTLHASADEASWISTAYSIGEIMIIPVTGMLMQVFGLRRFMIACCLAFMASALFSAFAPSLEAEIALRGIQGMLGGAFGVVAFGMVFRTFPTKGRAFGLMLLTFCQTFPANLGAYMAGYLTDLQYGWPMVYYLEIGLTLVILIEVLISLEYQPFQVKPLVSTDWLGFGLVAPGLALLIAALNQGNRRFWFDSPMIVDMLIVSGVLLGTFLFVEIGRTDGLVDFRLLMRRSFGGALILNMFFRFGLLETGYILPQFLGTIQAYRPLQVGNVLLITGAVQLIMFPLTYQLIRRVGPRVPVLIGLVLFTAGCITDAFSTSLTASDQFLLTQILLGSAAPLFYLPVLVIGTGSVKASEGSSASTFFNGSRSVATQMGTAFLATLIRYRENYHSAMLTPKVSQGALQDTGRLDLLQGAYAKALPDGGAQLVQASSTLAAQVRGQAYVLAFNDAFLVLGIIMAIGACLTLMLPPTSRVTD